MKPIGPLMIEHRLIERMIGILENERRSIERVNKANSNLIYNAVDFFRTYADRTHHGKEEDILFKELAGKPLSPEHKKIMEELIAEHVIARKNVAGLFEANERYRLGETAALQDITRFLKILTELYPSHIQKEDKRFFLPVMNYFSQKEQSAMLAAFNEFDRNMIHERYKKMVEQYRG